MSNLNYELSLLNSPYFDKLLSEMKIILEQKRKLLAGIRNSKDFKEKLSYADQGVYGSIIKREEELLIEMIHIKGWSVIDESNDSKNSNLVNDFDHYDNSSISNFN